jgi:hypothetical protein
MQQLTIRAANHLAAQDLYSALAAFAPELSTDDEGRCFVSVELGSDERVLEVLDAVQRFVGSRAEGALRDSVIIEMDEREFTIRPE